MNTKTYFHTSKHTPTEALVFGGHLCSTPCSKCATLCSFLLPAMICWTLQVYRAAQPDAKKQGINTAPSDPSVSVAQVANSESPIAAPSLSPPGNAAAQSRMIACFMSNSATCRKHHSPLAIATCAQELGNDSCCGKAAGCHPFFVCSQTDYCQPSHVPHGTPGYLV